MKPNQIETDEENYFHGERILAMDADRMVTYTATVTSAYKRDSLGLGWVLDWTIREYEMNNMNLNKLLCKYLDRETL